MIEMLPHLNATLNAVATVLLVVGLLLIKRGDERLHKATMVSAFAVSAVFLVCYLIHKAFKGTTEVSTRGLSDGGIRLLRPFDFAFHARHGGARAGDLGHGLGI
ncbi:MAG: DUF420 domain-containing protein [Pirellulaceae bacterium]